MQPQPNFSANSSGEQFCAQCGTPMPKEMRFCRSCGNRLGEGPAEYTETVRFPHATAPAGVGTTPFYPSVNAPLIQQSDRAGKRKRLGFTGMTWVWILLGLLFAVGGIMSLVGKRLPPRTSISVAEKRSYLGVNRFDTTDAGVTFKNVEPPDGPADKAGLVGGDIIVSIDGRSVNDADDALQALERTPVGKTVEVIYRRDGETKKTQLTTISREESRQLERIFDRRPEGKGMFGFESDRMTRINKPENKTFGVRIDYVDENGPAQLFGIKEGDIITKFGNVPIRTPEEFLSRVQRALPYSTVYVELLRDGQRMVIPVKIGKLR